MTKQKKVIRRKLLQKKVLENLYTINVDYQWWDSTYEDARQIGLEIEAFDIDRGTSEGRFTLSPEDVMTAILHNHGDACSTFKTAEEYKNELSLLSQDDEDYDEKYSDIKDDFLRSLLEDYCIILSKEYDYLTSEEAIKETIECNDYEFTAEGKIV